MGFWDTLFDVVLLLGLGLSLGVVLERLKQSAILGYLLAGTLLGPGAFNVMRNQAAIGTVAELGVALLLFAIGLEFSWKRLRGLGSIALAGGSLQILVTMAACGGIAVSLGRGPREAITLGAMIALSSTACVLRMLLDRGELESNYGRASVGVLLLQDLAIVPLVLLVTTLGTEGSAGDVAISVGRSVALGTTLFITFYLVSRFLLPKLMDAAALSRNRELPILLAATTCLAATWAAHGLGFSPALGAFVAGVLLAESPFATQIRADVDALRTLFVALFFSSVGMLANLTWASQHWLAVLGLTAAIVVGKALIVWPVAWLFLKSHRQALAAGICLAQVGEFSFVLAQIARGLDLFGDHTFRLFISATLATLLLTPFLVAAAPRVAEWIDERILRSSSRAARAAPADGPHAHVLVVGFGPAGREVMEALRKNQIVGTVIELNPQTVAEARRQGLRAIVGDASMPAVLEHAALHSAAAAVVTIPNHRAAVQVVQLIRRLAPSLPIVARARQHAFGPELVAAGADVTVDEEHETGRLLGNAVMVRLEPHHRLADAVV